MIRSFLDCAETAVAVALAYDWLHPQLSIKERLAIEDAIRRIVLEPALSAYEDRTLLLAAAALDNCALVSALRHPRRRVGGVAVLSRTFFGGTRRAAAWFAAWDVFSAMAPDGGAGARSLSATGRWRLRYAGLTVAALESTLGDSFGLAERPGFAQSGDFALHAAARRYRCRASILGTRNSVMTGRRWLGSAHRFGRADRRVAGGGRRGLVSPCCSARSQPRRGQASPMTLRLPTGKVFRSRRPRLFSQHLVGRPRGAAGLSGDQGRQCCGAVRRLRAEARECLFARSGRRRHIRRRWGAASLGGRPRRRRLRPAGIFRARRGRPVRAPMALLSLARGRPQHPHDRRARPRSPTPAPATIVGSCTEGRRQMGRACWICRRPTASSNGLGAARRRR